MRLPRIICALVIALITTFASANAFADSHWKILFINSYHLGDEWSDGISRGVESRILVEDVWFKTHYMDTKRRRSPEEIEASAKKTLAVIRAMKPDIVITADDNAAKYVIEPNMDKMDIPFVFCGINWDASVYGFPTKNVTGMVEVNFIGSLVDLLAQYSKGNKLGYLSMDALSGHRSLEHYSRVLKQEFEQVQFVNTYAEWQARFIELQGKVDMMVLEDPSGIDGWENDLAIKFVRDETRIPVGTTHVWMAPMALLTITKIPEEQGWWAADTAMKILQGKKPADFPIAQNKQGKLIANMGISEKLGLVFSREVLQTAEILSE